MIRRVFLATISLDNMAGGLEKNFVRLANDWAARDIETHLITFDREGSTSFYAIHPSVIWHKIGRTAPHEKVTFMQRLRLLLDIRAVLKSQGLAPSILLVFTHNLLARFLLATLFLNQKIVCTERNSLSLYDHVVKNRRNLSFFLLHFVHRIVVLLPQYISDYPALWRSKMDVIGNIVEPAIRLATPHLPCQIGRNKILAVGRLCDQKNYIVLLEAFKKLAPDFIDWDLEIFGEGELIFPLQEFIKQNRLEGRIFIKKNEANIASIYADANIFCMPSKWEGFPNALAEALAHGLPAVGFASCAGVNALISDGENGYLVARGALGVALRKLMEDAAIRERMSKFAVESVAGYRLESIRLNWDHLFSRLEGK